MSIQVNEFRHIPGKNDAEYIKLLKEHLEIQKQLTFRAIAKIKELTLRESTLSRTMADIQDEIEEACGHLIRL